MLMVDRQKRYISASNFRAHGDLIPFPKISRDHVVNTTLNWEEIALYGREPPQELFNIVLESQMG